MSRPQIPLPGNLAAALQRPQMNRRAPSERGQRAVQQMILRAFATTGRAPERAELAAAIRPYRTDLDQALAELDREDFVALDPGGQIRAAYPFPGVPTAHRVRINGAVEVYAMCAIDALGIAPMPTPT